MQQNAKWNVLKKQRQYYSGKKKKHTIKIQIVADAKTRDIICVDFAPGHIHDFALFKGSKLHFASKIRLLADKGYQGIKQLHKNSKIPFKASKKHKLTHNKKKYNSLLSKLRIEIEHINRYLKRFRILSSRYRNRRNKFALRASLICGI